MSSILFYPKFKGQSATGDTLANGLLYTYEAGTSTLKDTYSDAALTTPNTNPVVLNSNGEATVWLSGIYKFILKDLDGILQWTKDNVASSITDTTFHVEHNSDGTHQQLTVGSDANGDMYYRNAGVLTRLAKGTEGSLLTMGALVPEWSTTGEIYHKIGATYLWLKYSGGYYTSTAGVNNTELKFTQIGSIVFVGGELEITGTTNTPAGNETVQFDYPIYRHPNNNTCTGAVYVSGFDYSQQYLVTNLYSTSSDIRFYDVYQNSQSTRSLRTADINVGDKFAFFLAYSTDYAGAYD